MLVLFHGLLFQNLFNKDVFHYRSEVDFCSGWPRRWQWKHQTKVLLRTNEQTNPKNKTGRRTSTRIVSFPQLEILLKRLFKWNVCWWLHLNSESCYSKVIETIKQQNYETFLEHIYRLSAESVVILYFIPARWCAIINCILKLIFIDNMFCEFLEYEIIWKFISWGCIW